MKTLLASFLLLTGTAHAFGLGARSTQCVSHRGATERAPENSFVAFHDAVNVLTGDQRTSADVVEFDLHHTKDGQPIVMHDSKLSRTVESKPGRNCELKKAVKKQAWKDIRDNCRLKFSTAEMAYLNSLDLSAEDKEKLREIPHLVDVVNLYKNSNVGLFVELKDRPTAETSRILRENYSTRPDLLKIISFSNKSMDALQDGTPFWREISYLLLTPVNPAGFFRRFFDRRRSGDGISIRAESFSTRTFTGFKDLISVWTVNAPAALKKFFDLKVDYITTDNLQECVRLRSLNATASLEANPDVLKTLLESH